VVITAWRMRSGDLEMEMELRARRCCVGGVGAAKQACAAPCRVRLYCFQQGSTHQFPAWNSAHSQLLGGDSSTTTLETWNGLSGTTKTFWPSSECNPRNSAMEYKIQFRHDIWVTPWLASCRDLSCSAWSSPDDAGVPHPARVLLAWLLSSQGLIVIQLHQVGWI
jgi:hypothetical protein